MGLFSKKEEKVETDIPALPRLPRLPDFSEMEDKTIHQLPSFPSNSLGKKFSRDSIKDAVSGERGGGNFYADEFSDDEMRMMRGPLRKPMTEEVEEDEEAEFPERMRTVSRQEREFSERPERMERMRMAPRQETEPVFVRIDKFEEGLKIFEGIRDQISEIERILAETKRLKEKEDAELRSWENELKRMKGEIERMGGDIFSRV